jgi:hypothetical protein
MRRKRRTTASGRAASQSAGAGAGLSNWTVSRDPIGKTGGGRASSSGPRAALEEAPPLPRAALVPGRFTGPPTLGSQNATCPCRFGTDTGTCWLGG